MNMRALANWLVRAAIAAATLAPPLHAQSSRDSAGVLIVENARPAWSDIERLSLAAKPRLMIGNTADSAYRFREVRGVMLLKDGRIAVADAASLELRLFSPQGQFLSASAGKGNGPGQILNMSWVRCLDGDTIAIGSGLSMATLYSNTGQFVRPATFSPRVAPPARPLLLVALMNGGLGVVASLPRITPHPTGSRWTESLSVRLATDSINAPRGLGTLPYIEMEQVS